LRFHELPFKAMYREGAEQPVEVFISDRRTGLNASGQSTTGGDPATVVQALATWSPENAQVFVVRLSTIALMTVLAEYDEERVLDAMGWLAVEYVEMLLGDLVRAGEVPGEARWIDLVPDQVLAQVANEVNAVRYPEGVGLLIDLSPRT
jgi:hypothetical protein